MSRTFVVQESGFPDLPQLMLATVESLREIGGSASIHELDEAIIEREGVSEEEQAFTMPNDSRPKLKYYLAWARTYLKRGDALQNSSRGVWALTDIGEKIGSRNETLAIHKLNRPGFTGGYFVQNLSYFIKGIQVCIEVLLCFFWCDISDRAVQAFCVVPVHPFQGFPFNLAHGFPRAKEVNDFGFE